MGSVNGTLGECIANRYGIRATCAACWHSRDLDLAALAERLGSEHGALHADLAPKLRCTACGGRQVMLTVRPPDVPTIYPH